MLTDKIATYRSEFAYAWLATKDMPSRAQLLLQTVLFHGMNALGNPFANGYSSPIANYRVSINLEICPGYSKVLHLRPFAGDLFILYEVLMSRCYAVTKSLLPPEQVRIIVDCGANVGITSLYLASRYPNATVFSIEPHPANYSLLEINTKAEPRITPIHAALVGEPTAGVRLTTNKPAWGNKVSSDGPGVDVSAITISELLTRYNLDRIDLLKVDIEGAESSVFGHAEFLPKVGFGIIELHNDYTKAKFDSDLSKWGYSSTVQVREDGVRTLTFAPMIQAKT